MSYDGGALAGYDGGFLGGSTSVGSFGTGVLDTTLRRRQLTSLARVRFEARVIWQARASEVTTGDIAVVFRADPRLFSNAEAIEPEPAELFPGPSAAPTPEVRPRPLSRAGSVAFSATPTVNAGAIKIASARVSTEASPGLTIRAVRQVVPVQISFTGGATLTAMARAVNPSPRAVDVNEDDEEVVMQAMQVFVDFLF